MWSSPPPATSTASLAPGGTAILVKNRFAISELRVEQLDEWFLRGRVCAAEITLDNTTVVVIAMYGFAPSHPDRHLNEAFFTQVGLWANTLTKPVLWGGDFNATVVASQFLSLIRRVGLWRISPDVPTTRGHSATSSGKAPIDHVVCNSALLDLDVTCACNEVEPISDHLALSGHFIVVLVSDLALSWRWPKPMLLPKEVKESIDWNCHGQTYAEWAECAVKWLHDSYQVPSITKVQITTTPSKTTKATPSKRYRAIRRLRGMLVRLETNFQQALWDKLCACIREQGGEEPSDLISANNSLSRLTSAMYTSLQEQALKAWRERVQTWNPMAKSLYKYLRNETPTKCTALVTAQGDLTYVPTHMEACLEEFWAGLETWPDVNALENAIEAVEDVYALFMPCFPYAAGISPDIIMAQLRRMKKTAAGPDGWTRQELRALPIQAWHDLLCILWNRPQAVAQSVLALFKRVPLRKDPLAPPVASNFRPIDVFSLVFRLLTSCQVAVLRPWLHRVLHHSQYASDKGAWIAVAQMNVFAEAVLHGSKEVWAFTADFSKLYNTMSCEVAERAARLFGLELSSAPWLVEPLKHVKGCWRMPANAVVPFRQHERGLPQGVATSVILSELCVAMFLWRLHAIVRVETICYVDDLSVMATNRDDIEKAFDLLVAFTQHLHLALAETKTKFWGTYPTQLMQVAAGRGVAHTDVLSALGLEWGLRAGVSTLHVKEMTRINHCRERLKRLAHLPASIATKMQGIVTGCLSLLTYSIMPESKHNTGLRISVRHALNQPHGSPEVVFHVLVRSSCDPLYYWVMACCKLLSVWLSTCAMPSLATLRSKRALLGRVSAFLRWAKRAGWIIQANSIEVPGCGTIRFCRVWSEIRDDIRGIYRKHAAKELQKRRPALYCGLQDWNFKEHRKFVTTLDPHSAAIVMRIWTGAAMTASHAFTIGKADSPACRCGHPQETVYHLVFECPFQPACPIFLAPWKEREAYQSRAFLCPRSCSKDDRHLWRALCKRAISVLSSLHPHEEPVDWKGHEVVMDKLGEYAFCINCLSCRKARDAKHLAARECGGMLWGTPLAEGAYLRHSGHVLRLEFRDWKVAARRPALQCQLCDFWCGPPMQLRGLVPTSLVSGSPDSVLSYIHSDCRALKDTWPGPSPRQRLCADLTFFTSLHVLRLLRCHVILYMLRFSLSSLSPALFNHCLPGETWACDAWRENVFLSWTFREDKMPQKLRKIILRDLFS